MEDEAAGSKKHLCPPQQGPSGSTGQRHKSACGRPLFDSQDNTVFPNLPGVAPKMHSTRGRPGLGGRGVSNFLVTDSQTGRSFSNSEYNSRTVSTETHDWHLSSIPQESAETWLVWGVLETPLPPHFIHHPGLTFQQGLKQDPNQKLQGLPGGHQSTFWACQEERRVGDIPRSEPGEVGKGLGRPGKPQTGFSPGSACTCLPDTLSQPTLQHSYSRTWHTLRRHDTGKT